MASQTISRRAVAHADVLLTVAALVVGVITSLPGTTVHGRSPWELVLTVAAWLPLLGRLRWPVPVAAIAITFDALHIAIAAHHHPAKSIIPAATMLALFTIAERRQSRLAWAAGGLAAVIQLSVAASSPLSASADALYVNWALVATAVGRLVSERRQRITDAEQRAQNAEMTKEAEAQRRVTAERIRIAHDLHDVLAHHIAVVNAQAGVAQYLLRSDPEAAEKALTGIAENTRAALDELRATLGVLRTEGGARSTDEALQPALGADQLPRLLDGFVQAGMDLEIHVSGVGRPLPTPSDLALYRITQEALTNATKHAPGSHVRVDLEWIESEVKISVVNAPSPPDLLSKSAASLGTGNGLIGMRERAVAAGGSVLAQPDADGRFRVCARLPAPLRGPAAPEPFPDRTP